MIRVITVEREYGSGGGDIAAKVAARLGWKLWDQLLTEEIARRMDCERRAVEEHQEKETRYITACSRPSCAAASKAA